MNRNEIIAAIKMLAGSQGFYSRLYEAILSLDEVEYNNLMDHLESKEFSDTVDMVLYFEC